MAATGQAAGPADMTIVVTFDDAWLPHFATCLLSMAGSRGAERIHLVLVAGPTLTEPATAAALNYAHHLGFTADVIRPSEQALASLPPTRLFSPLVWYRLLLPDLLPDHDKVLSFDVDTLVLQSLAPLFEHDLGDSLLGAVSQTSPAWTEHYRRIGLQPAHRYFNAGVLLMNLAEMRNHRIPAEVVALGHERIDDFTFAEQDALNYVARDRWAMLHPKWNALSYLWVMPGAADDTYTALERETARRSPAVVHFEGSHVIKPWHFSSSHPLRDLYREYRAHTPWPLERLEGISLKHAGMRRLPVKWQYAIQRARAAVISKTAERAG